MRAAAVAVRPARGGLIDILLVLMVLLAAWQRTPVGGMASRAVHWGLGMEHQEPTLTSYFRIEQSLDRLEAHLAKPAPPASVTGALPEPYRSAARIVLVDGPSLAEIDAAWSGDPSSALERAALGEDLTHRAIERARAAGRANPGQYRAHRDYLPEAARRQGDIAVEGVLAIATLLEVQWPVPHETPVSSGYGDRLHPVTGKWRLHNGVDLAVPVGTPVLAAQSGKVVTATENQRSGRYLVLDHGNGVRTAYCHLDRFLAADGVEVARGEQIAWSGNSGRSTGPHLHFVVRVNGKTIDPLPLR
jgi:murein DD-endopeptidase MepM/ murein hydrolase activator NlpD